MTDKELRKSTEEFEKSLQQSIKEKYVLRLFVSGMTSRSLRAIETIKKICEEQLRGHYELEVIDIFQQPELAKKEAIVAVPTLVKKLPLPLRMFIGDLSNTERVLVGLNLIRKK